ncbi:MAG: hypothetical protein WBA46_18585, partial [Thermomicrobiales bacterium]
LPEEGGSSGEGTVPQVSGTESTSAAQLQMNPRAVRLSPGGQVTILIQPLVNIQWQTPNQSVTITIPSSLKLIGDPFCVAVSATLTRGSSCSGPATIGPTGTTIISVSPGSSERGMNGIMLTVSSSDSQTDEFAKIGASLDSGDGSAYGTARGSRGNIAYTSVSFADELSIVSTSHPGSRVVLLELTHDFAVNGSFCWASQLTQTPDLTLQLWGDGNNVVELSRQSGFVGESTSDRQYQSCYIPYVSPSLPDGNLYVVKVGTCLRCGVGLVPMSSGADQVIPDYMLFPEPRPSQRGGNSSPEQSGEDLATIIYGRTFADYVTNTLPRLSPASVGSEVSTNSQHR